MHHKILPAFLISFLLLAFQADAQFVWRPKACMTNEHTLGVMFSLGNKGYIVGGNSNDNADANQVWEYDPVTNTFTQKNNFPRYIICGTGFVINGVAYVGLGEDNINYNYQKDFWQYDPVADHWTQIADFPGGARYQSMAFAINNLGYAGCGFNGAELDDVYSYNPSDNSWKQVKKFPGSARQSGVGFSIEGFGYMGLGWSGADTNLNDMYQYNPILNSWAQVAGFPSAARQGPGFFVLSDSFYISGGADFPSSTLYNDCWRYDPSSNTWAVQEDLACYTTPFANTGGFTINGHGYILNSLLTTANRGKTLLEFGPPDTSFIEQVNVFGNDTTYCSAFSRMLYTGNSCSIWSTGEVDSQIVVTSPGTYWATWASTCGMVTDTIHILSGNFPISLSIQNAMCGADNGSATVSPYGGSGPFLYAWANGDTSATISNVASGIYPVTVSDVNGCSSTATAIVDSSAIGNILINADTSSFCVGSGTSVCAPAGFNSYSWSSGQTNSCIYVQQGGNYDVTVSDGGNCSAVSNQISLMEIPGPPISISQSGDTLTCYNGTFYQWYFNGAKITGATQDTFIARNPGDYSVIVTDSNGCSAESNGIQILSAGISALDKSNIIRIYPNPISQDKMTLEVNENLVGSKLEIYDTKGSVVSQFTIENAKTEVDLTLESGVYILRISSGANMYVSKLVKL